MDGWQGCYRCQRAQMHTHVEKPLCVPEKSPREELVLLKSSFSPHPQPQQITPSCIWERQPTS